MISGNKNDIQLVLLDLDGTLLNNEKKIGDVDWETLEILGNQGVTRAFATGRNLYSALKVLPVECPFDYLIFSSGSGIFDWKEQKILFSSSIARAKVNQISSILKGLNLNFSIHFPIPDNHKYFYFKGNDLPTDFEWRNSLYEGFNYQLTNSFPYEKATQFLVILDNLDDFQMIAEKFEEMKIIRATSPIDGKSIWLEIFSADVSKAMGGKFLCNKLNISQECTLSIGNDYNDIDLLNWTKFSYIVDNAPDELKQNYVQCVDNQSNPLSFVYRKHWS